MKNGSPKSAPAPRGVGEIIAEMRAQGQRYQGDYYLDFAGDEMVHWADELEASLGQFVDRCDEIRNGSPNAFYQHVDEFCKSVRSSA